MINEQFFFNLLLISVFITAAFVFLILSRKTAPYGRHSKKREGALIGAKPGWVIMELPAVLVVTICFIISDRKTEIVPIVFILLWQLHYLQRTFIFPLLIRTGKSKWPISIVFYGFVFNVINGYLNGRYLFYFSQEYTVSWLTDPRFIIGVLVFIMGYVINLHSDYILRRLRKPGKTNYKIPRGGLFKYVSCPNYFGEFIEWVGWAIATWSLPGLAFAMFTFANLGQRAVSHYKWYKRNFPHYPKKRKAMIPFLY